MVIKRNHRVAVRKQQEGNTGRVRRFRGALPGPSILADR
jgi:hypothetical protein